MLSLILGGLSLSAAVAQKRPVCYFNSDRPLYLLIEKDIFYLKESNVMIGRDYPVFKVGKIETSPNGEKVFVVGFLNESGSWQVIDTDSGVRNMHARKEKKSYYFAHPYRVALTRCSCNKKIFSEIRQMAENLNVPHNAP